MNKLRCNLPARARAVENDVRLGRKPTLPHHHQQEPITRLKAAKETQGKIARSYNMLDVFEALPMTAVYIFTFSLILVVLCGIWLWKRSYRPEQDSLLIGESQAAATRARLITLLKSELSYDLQAIKMRKEAKDLLAAIYKSPLKFGFQRIISNNGDMKVMKNLDVIYALSEAYANIDNTDYWEHRYFDATTGLTSAMHHLNPDGSQTTLAQIVTPTYEPTEHAVVKAIGALGRDPIP